MNVLLYVASYLSALFFPVACTVRTSQYARTPLHLRWELYPAPQESPGCRGVIPLNELESRWRDYEGNPLYDSSKRSHVKMAIFVEGKKQTPAIFCRVE